MNKLTVIREPVAQQIADHFKLLIKSKQETVESLKKKGVTKLVNMFKPVITGGELVHAFHLL